LGVSMFFALLVFVISLLALIRHFLVFAGMHKGPVLATFEVYGEEPRYYPLPWILLWIGLMVMSIGYILHQWLVIDFLTMGLLGVVILFLAWISVNYSESVQQYSHRLPVLPLWYARLQENTSRNERRRLAYMWLRLPLRTRLLYNASDHAFFLWADLVIAATVGEV
jgi:hypothetical protein